MSVIVIITGGIGSGKSVVCRILGCLGFRVYDCDSRAKRIMDDDISIKREIAERVTPHALRADMSLDRGHIAEVVFSDKSKLEALNAIVHGAVRKDIEAWARRHADDRMLFIETAIPKSSGLENIADAIWIVEAPADVRIPRVCLRNDLDPESVARRMESQRGETEISGRNVCLINNDDRHSLLLRIDALLGSISEDRDTEKG